MIYITANLFGKHLKLIPNLKSYISFSKNIKNIENGCILLINKILLIRGLKKFQLGKPFIEKTKLPLMISKKFKGKKTMLLKRKPKKGYKTKYGIRSVLAEVVLI